MRDVNRILKRIESNSDFRKILLSLKSEFSEQLLFVFEDENGAQIERTYNDFVNDVINSANFINIQNNRPKKHLAVFVSDNYEYIVLFFASLCGACVITLIDAKQDLDAIYDNVVSLDVDLILYDKNFMNRITEHDNDVFKKIDSMHIEELINYRNKRQKGSLLFQFDDIDQNELHVIVPTSGTVAKYQKYVMLSAANFISCLESNIAAGIDTYRFNNKQKVLSVLPLVHVFSLIANVLLPVCCGDVVYLSSGLEQMDHDLLKYNPTLLCVVPLIAERLINKYKASIKKNPNTICSSIFGVNLREVMLAGASIPEELVKSYHMLGYNVMRAYGMSEATANVITSYPLDKEYDFKTLGHAMPKIRIQIQDGEICVKSKSVMLGYYKNEHLTKQTIVNGWLKTGDGGYISEDGRIYFSGRIKNMIVLENGENIVPEEIENFFSVVDGIDECVLFSKEDKRLYLLAHTEQEYMKYEDILAALCKRNLSLPYGKQVNKFFITEKPIPKTNSGKIKRSSLKEYLVDSETQMIIKEILNSMMYLKYDIKGNSTFKNDLDLSSLDMVMFWSQICKAFNVKIPQKVFLNLNSIEELSECIIHKKFIHQL